MYFLRYVQEEEAFYIDTSVVTKFVDNFEFIYVGDGWASQDTLKALFVNLQKDREVFDIPVLYKDGYILSIGNIKNYDYFIGYFSDDFVGCDMFGINNKYLGYIYYLKSLFGNFRYNVSESIFKHLFSDLDIKLSNVSRDFIYRASFSPRNEIYKKSAKFFFAYDVNSMYPFLLSTMQFPIGKPIIHIGISTEEFSTLLNDYEGIGSFDLHVPNNWFGLYPYKTKVNDVYKTFYIQNSTMKDVVITFNELRYLLKFGCELKKCRKVFVFEKTFLSDEKIAYMYDIYELREKIPLLKKSMNRVIGKLGRSSYRDIYKLNPSENKKKFEDNGWKIVKDIVLKSNSYLVKKRVNLRQSINVNPLLYLYVIAEGRMVLTNLLLRNDDNMLYCDTDCIHCELPLEKASLGFGGFKMVKAYDIKYFLPKKYVYKDKRGSNVRVWSGFFGGKVIRAAEYRGRKWSEKNQRFEAWSLSELTKYKRRF